MCHSLKRRSRLAPEQRQPTPQQREIIQNQHVELLFPHQKLQKLDCKNKVTRGRHEKVDKQHVARFEFTKYEKEIRKS